MTYEEREAIFAKEALTNTDVCKLFDVKPPTATKYMKQWKRVAGDRLGMEGRIHVQDYLDFMQIQKERMDMYRVAVEPIEEPKVTKPTVCWGGTS